MVQNIASEGPPEGVPVHADPVDKQIAVLTLISKSQEITFLTVMSGL